MPVYIYKHIIRYIYIYTLCNTPNAYMKNYRFIYKTRKRRSLAEQSKDPGFQPTPHVLRSYDAQGTRKIWTRGVSHTFLCMYRCSSSFCFSLQGQLGNSAV